MMSLRNVFSRFATPGQGLGLILLLALVNGLFFAFLVPPWQHYDEPGHFEYAWLIAHWSRLPDPNEYDPVMRRQLASSMIEHGFYDGLGYVPDLTSLDQPAWIGIPQIDEPQLYYQTLAFPLKLAADAPLDVQLWVSRIVNLVFFLLTVLAGWGLMQEVTPEKNPLRWIFPTTLAIIPNLANLMTAVNNDAAAVAFFSLFLWGGVLLIRNGFTWKAFLFTAGATLLCAFTKTTTILAIPLFLTAILFSLLRTRRWLAWWIFLGIGFFLIVISFSFGDAQYWYRSPLQEGATRVRNQQAILGEYVLRLDPGAQVNPRWLRPIIQPVPEQVVKELAGKIVTVGAWMWANHPIQTRMPVLTDGMQSYSKKVTLSQEPVFFKYQVKIPKKTQRMWISLIPGNQKPPDQSEIYFDGLVLAEGARPKDQPPIFSDETGRQGEWGGLPFQNFLRNHSGESGALRLRNWVNIFGSRFFPEYGQPSFIFSSLTDLQGSRYYYRNTVLRLYRTFWGEFGWGHVPLLGHKPYRVMGVFTLLGIIGAGFYLGRNAASAPWEILFFMGSALVAGWGEALVRSAANLVTIWYYLPVARYAFIVILPTMLILVTGWLDLITIFGQRLKIPLGVRYMVYFSLLLWMEVYSVTSILYFYYWRST